MSLVGGAVFADLLRALAPYLDDVVFVGGWVQALYVLESEGADTRVIRTSDIDLTLPSILEAGDRPPLIDLLLAGGFEVDAFDGESGFEISKDDVDIDLLTESPTPGEAVRIDGQPDLRVFGYPHQALLRENTRYLLVGAEVDDSVQKPVQILIPTLPAYGDVAGQIIESSGFHIPDDTTVKAQIKGRLTRLLVEGWDDIWDLDD